MKNVITKIIVASLLIVFGVQAAPAPVHASSSVLIAQANTSLKDKIKKQNNALSGENGAGLGAAKDPREIAASIIKVLLSLVGTILVVYFIYGGFLIMTAAGDTEKVSKGKSILVNGSIGLAIILTAYAITTFVSSALLDATGAGSGGGNGSLPPAAGPSQGFYGN